MSKNIKIQIYRFGQYNFNSRRRNALIKQGRNWRREKGAIPPPPKDQHFEPTEVQDIKSISKNNNLPNSTPHPRRTKFYNLDMLANGPCVSFLFLFSHSHFRNLTHRPKRNKRGYVYK